MSLLRPLKVLFWQKHMSSVLAVRHKAWLVFFIGTGDGQLIKASTNIEELPMHFVVESNVSRAENPPVTFMWSQNMTGMSSSAANLHFI